MTILDHIVERTREVVSLRRREIPASDLQESPLFSEERRRFAEALRTDSVAVIAEVKKASPSKGIIRADFDPLVIAEEYAAAGAAAISVLTEEDFFAGSLDFLRLIRGNTGLPLLRKDFIIDPYQLVEARAFGGDAVLLIAAVLKPAQLHELHTAATELGLASLVEIYDPRELDRLDVDRFEIVGVNNRDLRTFDVDLRRSIDVLRLLPPHIIRVSESGIETGDDLLRLHRHGIDAVLIGETLMREPSPGEKLKEMLHRLAETAS